MIYSPRSGGGQLPPEELICSWLELVIQFAIDMLIKRPAPRVEVPSFCGDLLQQVNDAHRALDALKVDKHDRTGIELPLAERIKRMTPYYRRGPARVVRA